MTWQFIVICLLLTTNIALACAVMWYDTQREQLKGYIARIEKENAELRSATNGDLITDLIKKENRGAK